MGCWRVSSSAADNTSNTAQSLSKDKTKIQKNRHSTDRNVNYWYSSHNLGVFPLSSMPRFQALEWISAVLYAGGGGGGGWRGRREPPLLPPHPPLPWCLPSPWAHRWCLCGVSGGCGSRTGWWCRHGWDAVGWSESGGEGKGHWRLSSVSDRENAVTTSSAPENQQRNVPVTFIWSIMVRTWIFVLHIYVFFLS